MPQTPAALLFGICADDIVYGSACSRSQGSIDQVGKRSPSQHLPSIALQDLNGSCLSALSSAPSGRCSYLLLDLGQIERAWCLAWRIVLHSGEEFRRQLLDRHEHEHPIEEPIVICVGVVLRFLEGVPTQVEQQRHAQLHERFAPDSELLTAILQKND